MSYEFERHYLSCKIFNLRSLARKYEDKVNEEMLQFGMTYQRFMILWKLVEANGCSAKKVCKGSGIAVRIVYRQLEEMQTRRYVVMTSKTAIGAGGKTWEATKEGKRVFKICYAIWDDLLK